MNNYNCTNYESKECPKGAEIMKSCSLDNHFLMLGCWGVYCWSGIKDIYSWKEVKEGLNEILKRLIDNDILENFDLEKATKEYKLDMLRTVLDVPNSVLALFEKTTELYGQKSVAKDMVSFSKNNKTEALFLAGDNVYSYDVPKQKLLNLISDYKNYENYPTKVQYKRDNTISGQDIDKQLSLGFRQCYKKLDISNIFVGLGNHDIQTCQDLNQQLNFDQKNYQLPGTYYNVVYQLGNYKVNFIMLDTNLISEEFTCDGVTKILESTKRDQVRWLHRILEKNNADWNIVFGHVPCKANGHKKKTPIIHNQELEDIFTDIKHGNFPKVQLYMCADEHNQQYLHDDKLNMGLVVAGCGGTALNTDIQKPEIYQDMTKFVSPNFGFVSLKFNNDGTVAVNYHKTVIDEECEISFSCKIDLKGNLLPTK
jgi:hypothetical protein